jgi:hypothetical protein
MSCMPLFGTVASSGAADFGGQLPPAEELGGLDHVTNCDVPGAFDFA